MTYIRLTDDCQFFNAVIENDHIILNWNLSIDLRAFSHISLREIQIGPLSLRRHDYVIRVHSNIIARTLYNPLRELATIRCSRNSSFIDGTLTTG